MFNIKFRNIEIVNRKYWNSKHQMLPSKNQNDDFFLQTSNVAIEKSKCWFFMHKNTFFFGPMASGGRLVPDWACVTAVDGGAGWRCGQHGGVRGWAGPGERSGAGTRRAAAVKPILIHLKNYPTWSMYWVGTDQNFWCAIKHGLDKGLFFYPKAEKTQPRNIHKKLDFIQPRPNTCRVEHGIKNWPNDGHASICTWNPKKSYLTQRMIRSTLV